MRGAALARKDQQVLGIPPVHTRLGPEIVAQQIKAGVATGRKMDRPEFRPLLVNVPGAVLERNRGRE